MLCGCPCSADMITKPYSYELRFSSSLGGLIINPLESMGTFPLASIDFRSSPRGFSHTNCHWNQWLNPLVGFENLKLVLYCVVSGNDWFKLLLFSWNPVKDCIFSLIPELYFKIRYHLYIILVVDQSSSVLFSSRNTVHGRIGPERCMTKSLLCPIMCCSLSALSHQCNA